MRGRNNSIALIPASLPRIIEWGGVCTRGCEMRSSVGQPQALPPRFSRPAAIHDECLSVDKPALPGIGEKGDGPGNVVQRHRVLRGREVIETDNVPSPAQLRGDVSSNAPRRTRDECNQRVHHGPMVRRDEIIQPVHMGLAVGT